MTDIFLKVAGIDGGTTEPDPYYAKAFDALGYSFDVNQLLTVLADASSSADVRLDPLVVDLVPGAAGTTALLDAIAQGTAIDEVVLSLRKSDQQKTEFFQIKLAGAHVIAYGETGGAATRLAFDFRQVTLLTVEVDSDGFGSPPKTYSFDLDAPGPGRTASVDGLINLDSALPKGKLGTLTLDVSGYDGGSGIPGHGKEFNLAGYSFDFTNFDTLDGVKKLSPLVVDFASVPRDLAKLLEDGSDNAFLGEVTLTRDLGSKGSEVITILDTQVFSYSQANGDSRMALGYSAVHVEYRDGNGNVLSQFDFDVADRDDWTLDPEAAEVVREPGALDGGRTAFLSIDGVKGDVASGAYKDDFKAQAFHFDFSRFATDDPAYSPLVVDVDPRALSIPDLVGMMAKGQEIGAVTLAVRKGGASDFEFEKVALTGARLIGVEQKEGFATRLVFGYDKAALTISELDAQGHKKDTTWTFFDADEHHGTVGAATDTDAVVPLASPNTSLFVKFGDFEGPSNVTGQEKSVGLDGFDLGIDKLDAAGKLDFAPLVLDLAAGQGPLTKMIQHIAAGTPIEGDKSVVLHRLDGEGRLIEDVKLSNVYVVGLTEAGGKTQVALGYGNIDVQRFSYDEKGKQVKEGHFAFDAKKAKAVFDPAEAEASALDAGSGQDMHLKLDDIAGGSTDEGFANQFDILGYGIELAGKVGFSGGGVDIAKPHFSPLVVDFAPGEAGLAALLAALGSGRFLPSAVLDIRKPDGTRTETITLDELRVVAYDEGDGQATRVAFAYNKITVEKFKKDEKIGKVALNSSFEFDLKKAKVDIDLGLLGNLGKPEKASGAEAMLLSADGIDARSGVNGHETAFKVLAYDFGTAVRQLSGGGAPLLLDASPLTVTVSAGQTGLAALLDRASGGASLPTVALALNKDDHALKTITLKNAVVTHVKDLGKGEVEIIFGYGMVDLATGEGDRAGHTLIDLKTDDLIGGSDKNEAIDGGGGTDTLTFAALKTNISVDLAKGSASGDGVGKDTVAGVENVVGGEGDDKITGSDGANILKGGKGNDTLAGGKGDDQISGGNGTDTAVFDGNQGDFALTNLGGGNFQVFGQGFLDTLSGIEKLKFNDGVFDAADLLSHSPVLAGGIDDQGGQIDDFLEFSFSAAIFDDPDSDPFSELSFSAALADGRPLPSWLTFEAGTLSFSGTPGDGDQGDYAIKVTARDPDGFSSTVDFSISIAGPPLFDGPAKFSMDENGKAAATVRVRGGEGTLAFSMEGGADAKLFTINASSGELSFKNAPDFEAPKDKGKNNAYDVKVGVTDGQTTIEESITVKVANVTGDTVAGTSKDDVVDAIHGIKGRHATGEEDTITGDKGKDKLFGLGGDDTLSGGEGKDFLKGGSGRDTFLFDAKLSAKSNVDTVDDFSRGYDKIRLDRDIFKGLDKGKLDKDAFGLGTEATEKGQRILYDKKHGDLYFDRDGSKTKYDAVKFASVDDNTKLDHTDFFVV